MAMIPTATATATATTTTSVKVYTVRTFDEMLQYCEKDFQFPTRMISIDTPNTDFQRMNQCMQSNATFDHIYYQRGYYRYPGHLWVRFGCRFGKGKNVSDHHTYDHPDLYQFQCDACSMLETLVQLPYIEATDSRKRKNTEIRMDYAAIAQDLQRRHYHDIQEVRFVQLAYHEFFVERSQERGVFLFDASTFTFTNAEALLDDQVYAITPDEMHGGVTEMCMNIECPTLQDTLDAHVPLIEEFLRALSLDAEEIAILHRMLYHLLVEPYTGTEEIKFVDVWGVSYLVDSIFSKLSFDPRAMAANMKNDGYQYNIREKKYQCAVIKKVEEFEYFRSLGMKLLYVYSWEEHVFAQDTSMFREVREKVHAFARNNLSKVHAMCTELGIALPPASVFDDEDCFGMMTFHWLELPFLKWACSRPLDYPLDLSLSKDLSSNMPSSSAP